LTNGSTAFRAAVAAAPSFDMRVPTHPERTLFDLVQHVGMARRKSATIVAAGPSDAPPEKSAWEDGTGAPREREALLTWWTESIEQLTSALREVGPKGPSGSDCRLSDAQLQALAATLDEGPAAHGYVEDQRWTLARVAELIVRLFRQRYTLRGVSLLLHRMGFSPQVPKHRPVERDEEAIATWRREVWPQAK
jgi:transposase